jgi:tetratricopeptide (TPR) repeat protein
MSAKVSFAVIVFGLIAFTLFEFAPVSAQTDQQVRWCNGKDGATADMQIGGCTAAIQSGNFSAVGLASAFNFRGMAYDANSQYDQAIQDFNEAIKLDPSFEQAFNNRGNAYDERGQYDRAIQDFDEAIKLKPDYAHAYNNRGVSYDHKRDYDRAYQDYNKAIELDPNYAAAFTNRSYLKKKLGNIIGAQADSDEAKRINSKDSR